MVYKFRYAEPIKREWSWEEASSGVWFRLVVVGVVVVFDLDWGSLHRQKYAEVVISPSFYDFKEFIA
ncbi:MAG: hypothetical protein Q8R07_05560 [Candidatus Uhrbacteria bacterium]|nr:hypothetical protein [Candidatus Uhrbacteria bacterium]